jgi:hypothetical protein
MGVGNEKEELDRTYQKGRTTSRFTCRNGSSYHVCRASKGQVKRWFRGEKGTIRDQRQALGSSRNEGLKCPQLVENSFVSWKPSNTDQSRKRDCPLKKRRSLSQRVFIQSFHYGSKKRSVADIGIYSFPSMSVMTYTFPPTDWSGFSTSFIFSPM